MNKNNEIGAALQKYRKDNNLTQKDLAKKLGITQAHISRVEKHGIDLSENLTARIASLTGDFGAGFNFNLKKFFDEEWNYASFVYGEKKSGDRTRINTKIFSTKTVCIHCDAPGHDPQAKQIADNLVIGFEAVLSTINDDLLCTGEHIYNSLNKTDPTNK